MSLNADNVEAIARALKSVPLSDPPPVVQAVALKLPVFWLSRPALWFAQVEAQFSTRKPPIDVDLTKYSYVVSALDNVAAAEVEALTLAPPPANKYPQLRKHWSKRSGRHSPRRMTNFSHSRDSETENLLLYWGSLNAPLMPIPKLYSVHFSSHNFLKMFAKFWPYLARQT